MRNKDGSTIPLQFFPYNSVCLETAVGSYTLLFKLSFKTMIFFKQKI